MAETKNSFAAELAKQELVLTRVFDAPRSLVFKVWTDPRHLKEWWGPHGFTNPVCEVDARPGGTIRITMHAPEGVDYPMTGTFQEVVEPERLVFLSAAHVDKNGTPLFEILNTVTFAEYGEKTRLTLHARVLRALPGAAQALAGMEQGWSESLERLRDLLLSNLEGALANREIIVRRMLDAPRDLVFAVWTDPEHVTKWWGPNGFSTTIHEMDVSPGGIWRFVMHGPDGRDYHNRIVFLEVVKPERLAYKHDPEPGVEFSTHQTTVTFTDHGGKTLVTMRMLFSSTAERNRIVEKYGAVEGAKQTLGKMAEHVAKTIRNGGSVPAESTDEEFVISRIYDAPRDLVWRAWAEPERLAQWWGPKGFTMVVSRLDFRPGGSYHYGMRAPTGQVLWGKFVYREIIPPEKIVFVNSFSDESGGLTRHYMAANWPLEVLNTLTFTEDHGKTTITLRGRPINATEPERKTFKDGHKSMQQGFKGTLDQLADYLAKG